MDALGASAIPRSARPMDRDLLERALELAELGRPGARPNPVVGAVLARADGSILATGHHVRRGAEHAERACLADHPGEIPADATLYVTLEPCSHHGRQPPCSDLIIARGVPRVVFASCDANPDTCGRGPGQLAGAGIVVERGPADLERRALQQNAGFHSAHLRGRPYVTAKWAMTRNGRFATGDPQRRWITGDASREFVHYLRAGSGAIACGIGTVLADDPLLTVRGPIADRMAVPPLRVVFDRRLELPVASNLVRTAAEVPVIVACDHDAPTAHELVLLEAGVEVFRLPPPEPGAPCLLAATLRMLADREVQDLLLESGPRLLAAFHDAELIDSIAAFVAPFEAPATEPGLALDHPLVARALAVPGEPSGEDELHVALVHPAWNFPGAVPGK
ncbi:MAG: 5-amino-6-(5-phosphoribosylamino)uracil reductase / diaminohydroxyphosphoribosylaminopyrimidine [Thermoleophilia bacterium]|nr:5-amino-6-(5-phosphoribosylamino)uracil reductase / diaminohydroxyphosphoribosylaminopyrimidine [Thermoleophilia bacterium]